MHGAGELLLLQELMYIEVPFTFFSLFSLPSPPSLLTLPLPSLPLDTSLPLPLDTSPPLPPS